MYAPMISIESERVLLSTDVDFTTKCRHGQRVKRSVDWTVASHHLQLPLVTGLIYLVKSIEVTFCRRSLEKTGV